MKRYDERRALRWKERRWRIRKKKGGGLRGREEKGEGGRGEETKK